MRIPDLLRLTMLTGILGILLAGRSEAALEANFEGEPVRQIFVQGDDEKFAAHHWIDEGYHGGVKEFDLHYDEVPYDVQVSMKGHAIPTNNDYEGEFLVTKEGLGYVLFEYEEFRKYYDGTGGVFKDFSRLRVNELGKDLYLDIGHFGVEAGLTVEGWPEIILGYERGFRDGAKSRLTWTTVTEGSASRKIGPSFQNISEIEDVFDIEARHTVKGVHLKGKQHFEFVESELMREERDLANSATASQTKIRQQHQNPEARQLATSFEADKWFWNEKAHALGGYHFNHLNAQETENILELNNAYVERNFTGTHRIIGARADADYDSHTYVTGFAVNPWTPLSVVTRLKSERIYREGNSRYPADSTPVAAGGAAPDNIVDTISVSETDNKVRKWGESISLRFTGIPRTSIYNDFELEQIDSWLGESRDSLAGQSARSAGEIFQRDTIAEIRRGAWTLGGRFVPVRWIDFTSQVRHRRDNNDYDDKFETNLPSPGRSAFVDWQNVVTDEFSTRVTLRPVRWLQPAYRYQYRDSDFYSRFESDTENVKTDQNSHINTIDLILTPRNDLILMSSVSKQSNIMRTPAATLNDTTKIYPFRSDFTSWMFSGNYAVRQDLEVNGNLVFTTADNYDDIERFSLPLGAAYDQTDLTLGVRWSPMKRFTLEPKYQYMRYTGNHDVDDSDYKAHVAWVEFSVGLA
ncbi:MAG: hypothetical protein HY714_04570 [Candidatus Omnitrophica bacterium]|nr:hypothetical protein [Candidatus Omnitrophota bacterium]